MHAVGELATESIIIFELSGFDTNPSSMTKLVFVSFIGALDKWGWEGGGGMMKAFLPPPQDTKIDTHLIEHCVSMNWASRSNCCKTF